MKKLFTFVALLAIFALAGCASQQMTTIETTYDAGGKPLKTTELRSDYASYTKSLEAPKERPKLIDIECPASGCNFTRFAVYDPGSGGSSPHAAPPPDSLAKVFVQEMFSTVRGAIPYAAGAFVLGKAFDKANSSMTTTTSIDNSNRSVSTNTSTSTSASGAGAAAANGGAASGSAPTTTTTTNTTTTTTSNNSDNRTATGGNSGTTGAGGGASNGGS